jgi:type I restriction enzyme S subunit
MPRAKWEALARYPIVIPKHNILMEFNKLITSSVQKIEAIIIENKKLGETRDLLLPKLMKGEINL